MSVDIILLGFVAFLFAGTIKGVIGIGLPSASMSIMAQFFDPRIAVALLLLPILVSNVWQVYRSGRFYRSIKILWPFALSMMIFTWISAQYAVQVSTQFLELLTGCVIVLFAVVSLMRPLPQISHPINNRDGYLGARARDHVWQVTGGTTAGLLGGLTAIWGPPMIMYLLARRFDSDDFIRFTGFLFVVGSIPLLIGFTQNGLFTAPLATGSMLMIAPTLIGFAIGERLRHYIDGGRFRTVVLCVFLVMGLNIIRRVLI